MKTKQIFNLVIITENQTIDSLTISLRLHLRPQGMKDQTFESAINNEAEKATICKQ